MVAQQDAEFGVEKLIEGKVKDLWPESSRS
jgi:hypothetical protein